MKLRIVSQCTHGDAVGGLVEQFTGLLQDLHRLLDGVVLAARLVARLGQAGAARGQRARRGGADAVTVRGEEATWGVVEQQAGVLARGTAPVDRGEGGVLRLQPVGAHQVLRSVVERAHHLRDGDAVTGRVKINDFKIIMVNRTM